MAIFIDDKKEVIEVNIKGDRSSCSYYCVKFDEFVGFSSNIVTKGSYDSKRYEINYIFLTKYKEINFSYIKYIEDFTDESEINSKLKDIARKRKEGIFV